MVLQRRSIIVQDLEVLEMQGSKFVEREETYARKCQEDVVQSMSKPHR